MVLLNIRIIRSMSKLAHYKCFSCEFQWGKLLGASVKIDGCDSQTFIQHDAPPEGCPRCGHLYMKWENYGG